MRPGQAGQGSIAPPTFGQPADAAASCLTVLIADYGPALLFPQ
jgi:hypothetical protein